MSSYIIKKAGADSPEITELSNKLYLELSGIYPESILENFLEENPFMSDFLAAYTEGGEAVACGALRDFGPHIAEIKRMFVCKEFRGQGISKQILNKLEGIAKERGYSRVILETGTKQPEAVALYRKCGYTEIKPYGRHTDDPTTVCFEKIII